MNRRLSSLLLFLWLVAACANAPAPPNLRPGQAIAVLPPSNRCGDPLLVSGASFLDRYVFHAGPVTVSDVLAGEVRFQLAERGVAVIPQAVMAQVIDGQVPQSPQAAGEI